MASLRKRNGVYYAQWYVGAKQKRVSLKTGSLQLAKDRLRTIEGRLAQGHDDPLPTRTPIAHIVAEYVRHIRTRKTLRSLRTDVYYLRQMFGPCCPEIALADRTLTQARIKRPITPGTASRTTAPIEAACIEQVTTAQVADFIGRMVGAKSMAPKTANRYREIANRVFNWAIEEGRIRMPGDKNSVARVSRYSEPAPQIEFLTLAQIRQQLDALEQHPLLQALVAVYIYAGLRREEALWLTTDDVDLHSGPCGMIRVRAKTIGGLTWQPKSKVNRAVPVTSDLARFLAKYQPPPTPEGWFFSSPAGRRYDADNSSSDFRAVQAAAGLPWTCLHFRHTFGSQLAQKGVSLFKISALKGNSPDICRRHYAAITTNELCLDTSFASENPYNVIEGPSSAPTLLLLPGDTTRRTQFNCVLKSPRVSATNDRRPEVC